MEDEKLIEEIRNLHEKLWTEHKMQEFRSLHGSLLGVSMQITLMNDPYSRGVGYDMLHLKYLVQTVREIDHVGSVLWCDGKLEYHMILEKIKLMILERMIRISTYFRDYTINCIKDTDAYKEDFYASLKGGKQLSSEEACGKVIEVMNHAVHSSDSLNKAMDEVVNYDSNSCEGIGGEK